MMLKPIIFLKDYGKENFNAGFKARIATKIPIIIWKYAATAKFVSDNNIGIAVENLNDAVETINKIDEKHYKEMLNNISLINNKIKNGEFLSSAVEKALKIIEQNR